MEEKKSDGGIFDGVGLMIKEGIERRRQDPSAVLFDGMILLVAFLFSRCHIVFGAYPLGIATVAFLPRGVWVALIGAVVGSLSLGGTGVIHAIIAVIVVFLRTVISGGEKGKGGAFSEPLVLKVSAAAIGAFVSAVYQALLEDFSVASLLYGGFSVLLAAGFTFVFSGICDAGISFSEVVFGKRNLFSGVRGEKERVSLYIFQATFLLFIFLISISLKGYNVLGISPAYIFSSAITLIISRRFGTVRAMTVGFVSSLGISSVYSVAFALVGLGSGLLFSAGMTYALIGAGALLSVWSVYTGGSLGFLSTFPEYVTATLLVAPLIKKMHAEKENKESGIEERQDARDMVNSAALAYKNSSESLSAGLAEALGQLSVSLKSLSEGDEVISVGDYREITIDCVRAFCRDCLYYSSCICENPAPCVENIEEIATKLARKERLFADDTSLVPKYCHNADRLFDEITRSAAELEAERYKSRKVEAIADGCELFARLISEAQAYDERERRQNTALSEKLSEVFENNGLSGGSVKVFGERKKYFIGAAEDRDGSLVTSPKFHKDIEECASVRLGVPEYYRRGSIALFECASSPLYSVQFATVGRIADGESESGDTAISFESDGHFYSLIADGMGCGRAAHRTSNFTADFLSRMCKYSVSKTTAFHILNHVIKNRSEECSSSVDLFDFDLITGEAIFYKCGAAPSFVKRDSSIFRIRSETAPIGLMKGIDAEKVRVQVKPGDHIIMVSDGVCQGFEESAWLIELLSKEPPTDLREYAEKILRMAIEKSGCADDMSISVAKVCTAP